jgi:acyl-CoA thioesterase FadM
MFPFVRMIKDIALARRMPPLENFTDIHESHHICWPWDIDFFGEMNNGRVLSIYDLGRFAAAQRGGLITALFENKWGLAMAGAMVRYRRRLTAFERFTMRSRVVCWDDRFIYIEQSMWKLDGECANHIIYRAAVTEKRRSIPPIRVAEVLKHDPISPPMPDWIAAWVAAEDKRPWPPMSNTM